MKDETTPTKHETKHNKLQQQMSYGALIILAIVVVSFVAWPILSNGANRGNNLNLGSYRGKAINYASEYGLFNNNLDYFLQQFGSESINNPLQRRSLFERAFFSTVSQYGRYFHLLDKGNDVSEKEINSLIHKQFERDGKLDRVAWSRLQAEPNRLKDTQNIMTYIAAQNIWGDIYDPLELVANEAELELLVPTLGDMRKVSYLYYRVSEFPENELEKYYEQHKDLFAKKFLRRISVDSKENRNKVEADLKDDSSRFGEVAQLYSSDVYSESQGDWGNKFYYEIRNFFNGFEDVDDAQATQWAGELYALGEDDYAGPYEIDGQWLFLSIKSEVEDTADFATIVPTVRTYVENNEISLITDYFRKNLEVLKSRAELAESLAYLDQEGREVEASYSSTPQFFGFSYTGEEGSSLYTPLSDSFREDGLATAIGQSKSFFEDIFALDDRQFSQVLLLETPTAQSSEKYIAFFRLDATRKSNPADFAQNAGDTGLEGKKSLYNYYMTNLLTSGLQLKFLNHKNLKPRFDKAYEAWDSRQN